MIILKPFQEVGRDFLALRANAILADDMGTGKTYQAIGAFKKLGMSSGIIACPHSVRHTWAKRLREEMPMLFVKEIISSKTIPEPNAMNVVNYDIIWKEPLYTYFKDYTWQVLVCDESHYLRNSTTKRTKNILGRKGLYTRCERRWMMTGTPVLNRPIELYPVLRSLFPEYLGKYTDFYSYAYKFCAGMQGPFGFDCTGASNLELLSQILLPIMLRRLKKDVLPDLPDVTYDKVYLDPTDKLITLIEKENRALNVKKLIGEIPSIRRALGVIKATAAIGLIKDLLEEKDKLVVYMWHKDVGKQIYEAFKAQAVLFTGEQTAKEKDAALEKFQTDPNTKLFIGNLAAAGFGIDGLQNVCDTCLFVELSYVPEEIKQAIDRINRFGQKSKVHVQFLIAENSEDERIVNTLAEKAKNINQILRERRDEATGFVKTFCHCCKKEVEVNKLTRILTLTVCEDCKQTMECLI